MTAEASSLTATARALLELADEEPLDYAEDPDAIDALVASNILEEETVTVYHLTAAGKAALAKARRAP
jgi:hypothetical protein